MELPTIVDEMLLWVTHDTRTLAHARGRPRIDASPAENRVVLRLLKHLLSDQEINCIAHGAATAGHLYLLSWLISVRPQLLHPHPNDHFLDGALNRAIYAAIVDGQPGVLDLCCVVHGRDVRAGFRDPFHLATEHAQPFQQHQGTEGNGADRQSELVDGRLCLTLPWTPYFLPTRTFLPQIAWCTDDSMLVVDWWRNYCTEMGRHFTWPSLDELILRYLVSNNTLSLCLWWWGETARRSRFDLGPHLTSQHITSHKLLYRDPEILAWFLDRCAPESRLPSLTLNGVACLVSRGRSDLVERLLQVAEARGKSLQFSPGESEIDVRQFYRRVASPVVLDYLWDFFSRDLDAAKWWHAMYRVYGTTFPSADELSRVKRAPDSAIGRWIQSILS
ncbi:hypothetical protein BC828DRAFT_407613 [Blastocladiella britannica]|nr:hypothetical protein BC828DRAFT_407613 [Blastocladiella britannica]